MISSKQVTVKKLFTLKGHKDCIYTLERSDEEASFFSGAGDGMVVRWDLNDPEKGTLIAKVSASIYALHYVKKHHHLIVGENYEGIHIIDIKTKKEIGSVKITEAAIFDIQTFRDKILVANGDGMLTVLHYHSLKILKQIRVSSKSARSISINPDAQEFAVGYSDDIIRIFDLDNYQLKKVIEAHKNSVFTVRYSPDYKLLLSGSRDAHLKVWNVENNYELQESIVAHMYAINYIDFRYDSKYFVTCSMDKSIKVWDAQRFRLLKVLDKGRYAGHGTSVNRLLWTNYKDQTVNAPLISASDDRTISVWQIDFNKS